jgi:hypothetical protein
MWRSILSLMQGIFGASLLSSAISVYIIHDVDKDMISHLNDAFMGLFKEGYMFTAIVGVIVGLLVLIGRLILRMGDSFPRAKLSLYLGIGVGLLQYPCDLIGRELFPKYSDVVLTCYMVVAILLCVVVLLADNFRQKKLLKSAKTWSIDNFV